jgi:hypothetical protein
LNVADEKSAPTQTDISSAKGEVDIDELEVRVFIIAKSEPRLKQTAAFLSRRGWPTTVMSNITKAVEYIAEKRPDFVLISFNHNNPAILKLPELVSQTFGVECIGFVESGEAAGMQRLGQTKMHHKIQSSASGPTIHRTIRRILSEKLGGAPEERESSKEESAAASGRITVRGGGETKQAIVQKGGTSAPAYMPDHSGIGADHTNINASIARGPSEPNSTNSSASTAQNGFQVEMGLKSGTGDEPPAEVVSNGKYRMKKPRRRSLKDLAPDGDNTDLLSSVKKSLFGERGEALPEEATSELEPEKVDAEPQSLLQRAAVAALSKICRENSEVPPTVLNRVGKLAVVPVHSGAVPGYLVLALNTLPEPTQKAFFEECEKALRDSLSDAGLEAELETGFWVDLPAIAFMSWVDLASAFDFTMSHEGAEIGVAFFKAAKPLPRARDGGDPNMLTIEVDHISTSHPVTFKVYLHMKRNKKFYLYLRNGRQLQPGQKKRLKAGKHRNIFMKRVDIENLRAFLAAVFLHDTIHKSTGEAA